MKVTDGGSLNLLSRSCAEYNINELGLQKRRSSALDSAGDGGDQEKTYQCASSEMCVFGAIGWGASSVVRKAIHIPTHRILALKKINVFEKASKHSLDFTWLLHVVEQCPIVLEFGVYIFMITLWRCAFNIGRCRGCIVVIGRVLFGHSERP